MAEPKIAICVTTYQKPWHLRRSLESIRGQQGVDGQIEVVVTDDGSTDETPEVVEQFRRSVDFPVHFTTHPHGAFQVGRCRNEGAKATTARYILFVDGDCVLPPDHVAIHLQRARPGRALIGDCYRVEREISDTLSEEAARRGEFLRWHINGERGRLARQHRKAVIYSWLGHVRKPKLVGNNFGVWRNDFERINGFDENFCGWGQEDDDLGIRLRRAGVRLQSILNVTRLYHLWHPRDPSATPQWREGVNVSYFLRRGALICCRKGIKERKFADLAVRIIGKPADPWAAEDLWKSAGEELPRAESLNGRGPEVEILLLPGDGNFSGRAQCNMLVAYDTARPTMGQLRAAHIIVADQAAQWEAPVLTRRFPLAQFRQALDAIG